jgi:hypothetical protein
VRQIGDNFKIIAKCSYYTQLSYFLFFSSWFEREERASLLDYGVRERKYHHWFQSQKDWF